MKILINKRSLTFNVSSILLMLASLSIVACNSESAENVDAKLADNAQAESAQTAQGDNNNAETIMTLQGQVLYQQIEGGFFGFVATNGDKYLPSGLAKEYRKNGLIIEIKAQVIENLLTTQQYGVNIKVLEAKILDSSKVSGADDTF